MNSAENSSNFTLLKRLGNPKLTTDHACRVAEFMLKAGQQLPSTPSVRDGKIRELRVRLLLEEVLEFAEASGVGIKLREDHDATPSLHFEDFIFETCDEVNLIKAADGLADISVVTVGAMLAYGIADVPLLEEVDRNNLAKIARGHKCPKTGKWLKPPDHQPPRIADVLRAQGWCSTTEGGNENHEGNAIPVPGDDR
jgi:predicted HAD superfamily Cof-like phosphohydrolase